jgi:hypothetical protein
LGGWKYERILMIRRMEGWKVGRLKNIFMLDGWIDKHINVSCSYLVNTRHHVTDDLFSIVIINSECFAKVAEDLAGKQKPLNANMQQH